MEWANAHGRDRQAADVLISPCLPMYLADFSYSRPGHPSCPPERVKKLPLLPQNLQDLSTNGTIVHVDTGDLNSFSALVAPRLLSKVILVVGRHHLHSSQVSRNGNRYRTNVTTGNVAVLKQLLSNRWIMHIFMQNPELCHPDYEPLPYGITPYGAALDAILNMHAQRDSPTHLNSKSVCMWVSPISRSAYRIYRPPWWPRGSSPTKLQFPEYCSRLRSAFFVASPGGDRFDTYRHWEAIAFNSLPVSNLPADLYEGLFCDDMLFISSPGEMASGINCTDDGEAPKTALFTYHPPDRSKLLVSFWKHRTSTALAKKTKGVKLPAICKRTRHAQGVC